MSTAPLHENMARMRNRGLFVALGMAVIGGFLALLVSRTITTPLQALVGATKQITQGELSQKIAIQGRDEPAALARAFNEMTARLAKTYGELEQALVSEQEQRRRLQEMKSLPSPTCWP